MSDLSVSSATSSVGSNPQAQWAQTKNLWDQLGQALQSGDLAGAQKAFAALQANAPQGPASQVQGASTSSGQGSATQNPMSALASALQSGNLAAAQQAFSQIQQTQGHHHHPHHHGSQSSSSAPATASTTSTSSTTPTSSTPPADATTSGASSTNITINISGGNNIIV